MNTNTPREYNAQGMLLYPLYVVIISPAAIDRLYVPIICIPRHITASKYNIVLYFRFNSYLCRRYPVNVKNRYPDDAASVIPHSIFKLKTEIINGIKIFKTNPNVVK